MSSAKPRQLTLYNCCFTIRCNVTSKLWSYNLISLCESKTAVLARTKKALNCHQTPLPSQGCGLGARLSPSQLFHDPTTYCVLSYNSKQLKAQVYVYFSLRKSLLHNNDTCLNTVVWLISAYCQHSVWLAFVSQPICKKCQLHKINAVIFLWDGDSQSRLRSKSHQLVTRQLFLHCFSASDGFQS